MNKYDLLIEAVSFADEALLENVLTDAVSDVCLNLEGGMEAIENFINICESNQNSNEYNDMFSDMIFEDFLGNLSRYTPMILSEVYQKPQEVDSVIEKRRADKKADMTERLADVGKGPQFAKSTLPAVTTNDVRSMGKFRQKMRNWFVNKPGRVIAAIKKGYGKASKFVKDKYASAGRTLAGGIAGAKLRVGGAAKSAGRYLSDKGNKTVQSGRRVLSPSGHAAVAV